MQVLRRIVGTRIENPWIREILAVVGAVMLTVLAGVVQSVL